MLLKNVNIIHFVSLDNVQVLINVLAIPHKIKFCWGYYLNTVLVEVKLKHLEVLFATLSYEGYSRLGHGPTAL